MENFLNQLKAIPIKFLKMINGFIDGITSQISTTKGSVIFLIIVVILMDITLSGKVGVIQYSFIQIKELINIIIVMFVKGSWPLVVAIGVIGILIKSKNT